MIDQIMDYAKKVAEQVEVFEVEREESPVLFETNRLKLMETRTSHGLALRIVKNGRIGFSSTSRFDNPQEVVTAAVDAAEFGAEAKFVLPGSTNLPSTAIYNEHVKNVTPEDMIGLGAEMIARIRDRFPEVNCEGGLTKEIIRLRLLNSNGGGAEYTKSVFGIGIEGVVVNGTDMLFVWDSQSSCDPITDISGIVAKIIRRLEIAGKIVSSVSNNVPVIFTPSGVASALVPPLTIGFNGKIALEGSSPLLGKIGQQCFDRRLTLIDDPLIEKRPGSRPCDDEGIPSRRNDLIVNGIPKGFLYNLQTAGLAGTTSTGSASRSLDSLPGPSRSTLLISPGDTSFEKMVQNLKEGLVIEMLMGASQGNVLGGNFSGNVLLGYKVEAGEIVGRVKDTMVSGNVYDVLKSIVAIGTETEWVGGGLSTPALCLEGLSIASKS